MQIKLYGNGHSCNIPVQEIIDKYWKDETAPFSFEMSTAIGDETIAATAMLGEESPDTYPSIRLDSRNARKNSSATWFILETPNCTEPEWPPHRGGCAESRKKAARRHSVTRCCRFAK